MMSLQAEKCSDGVSRQRGRHLTQISGRDDFPEVASAQRRTWEEKLK